jgi:TatD DNase family protein
MHPLFAAEGIRELAAFKRMAPHANFIGEIGLDLSRQGAASKTIQERVFEEVLFAIQDRSRFITLHSRRAESTVLAALRRHSIRGAVFHWFTGSNKDFEGVIADGHYVSVNPAMLSTASGKRIVATAPRSAVLAESDGPFAKLEGRTSRPNDVAIVYQALAAEWGVGLHEAVDLVTANFDRITKQLLL